jgi:hypothetical protein
MKKIIAWIISRSGESSTWRGIVGVIVGGASAYFLFLGDTDKALGAITAGTAAIGFINTVRSEGNHDAQ